MKPDVAIFGDSWGCGEWSNPVLPGILSTNQSHITHLGLEQYFTDLGHKVFNMSKPAGSNKNSIDKLTGFLNTKKHNLIVLFIISDPTRNFGPEYATFKQDIVDHNGLFEFKTKTLYNDLKILNELGQQYKQVIQLIGALGSVPNIDQYSNLSCLCRSWPKLLVGDLHPDIDFEFFGLWERWLIDGEIINEWLTPKNLQQFDSAFADKLVQQLEQLDANRIIFEHQLFYPDNGHPNRDGHKILFNYIKEKLEL
jgi:hypothetical protein